MSNARILKRHISMYVTVLACSVREVRHLTPPFLANDAISLTGENSVTQVEITLGNVILCTSLKRRPYQTTVILINYWVKKKAMRRTKKTDKRYHLIYLRGSAFWHFPLFNNSNNLPLDGKKLRMSSSYSVRPVPSPAHRPVPLPLNT